MKLKQLPMDFVVDEIPAFAITSEKEQHTVFLLEKQEIDTFDAVRRIAQRLHLPLFEIGYAGLKDKHAHTRQYLSIPTRYPVQTLKTDSLMLTLVGYTPKKIKIGDLIGNQFRIVARDIKKEEISSILQRAARISSSGVPNYFDSQRFGSVINKVFIGKEIILGNYEKAVKQYLTTYQKSESIKIKNEKRRILSSWTDLSKIHVFNKAFSNVIKEYLKTKEWHMAYRKIPAHLREMYVNAYQSYLWNECVKELLKLAIEKKKLYSIDYAVGSFLFYTDLSEEERRRIPETFQTISDQMILSGDQTQILNRVLVKQGLQLADFKLNEDTGNFFKTRPRQVLLTPKDFTIGTPEPDEVNRKKDSECYKIQTSFVLPKGSYATIVTKRLFGH
jgi:tRNA pseudouridine13 synthase